MAGICSTIEEEEEEFGPAIYRRRRRRRPLSVKPSQRPVRSWVVADDDDDDDKNPERSVVFSIDPDVLDCPICLHPLFIPVFQCDNGHIACSSCCSKLNTKCPFCCTPIGINHCRGLEIFIQSITRISCKYANYGCKITMPYTDKTNHEQTCPHATCNCPHPSCSFTASYNNLYLHFHIQHAPSTTRFTCNTTFSLAVEFNQKRIFLQEQHSNVIFILNHQVREHGRAFSIDYLGPPASKSCFLYQLTAKSMKASLSLQSEPGIYTEWSSTYAQRKNYLTVPSGFEGYSGLLSLSVCIRRKCISSSPFEVEAEETVQEVFGNKDNGALQVVLADPGVLDCSICHEPLCTPVFQCQNGHLACCLCCSKVETICPICYPLGYKYTRCRGLEVAIESIGKKISCINETLAAAYSNKKSQHEQMCPPHSFQEDDDELVPIADVELDSLMSEEEVDEDELEIEGENHQQHTTNNENEARRVVLDDPNILDCMICSNLLFPPVFQCKMGHLACSPCCSELKGVCLCCMPNNKRCRGFEKFIESISSISCKNAWSGCKKTVPYKNKSKHEQSCPHATCWCPYPSCSFAGSFKSLYFHFDIKHTASTARFTYGTTFSVCIEIDQTTIYLQEQNENVIFILNHEVQEHQRALNIDCVGVGYLKSCFVYQLTAKNTETCLLLRSVPEIYTRWSNDTPRKCNLTIPSGFADYDGCLSLAVCIKKKVIPSEFEEEMKEVSIEFDHNLDGRTKVTLTNPDIFYCSICFTPLCRPLFQCEKGHLSCFSCCSKMNKKACPFCYTWTGYNHCQGLENIFESVIVPCKNDGCNMAMLLRYENEHGQMCPHATCFCPYPSCPFTGSHENLYLHFSTKHEADITRFTYGTTFTLCVGLNQDYLFLQEEEEEASVIFILNHQVQLHERVIYIDCVGTMILWSKFVCQLTAKSLETSETLECECEPEIFAKWSKHNMPLHEDYYLAVPSEFAGYSGLLSLSVCITKFRSWVVDDELIHNKNPPPPERSVFIKIDNPDVLDCPICLHALFTPVFQCDNGHIACSSCCSKLNSKCPFCCTRIGINRCRGLENFIQSITSISCKYANYGCKHTMPYTDKSKHEQTCPHATCNCPHPSCSFTASYKHLYLHFHIQHAPSTTRFTCNTTFSLGLEINQKRIFLQEQHGNAIFVLNHQVKEHGRAISIDYLGPPTSKSCFVYHLTAKTMKTSLLLQSEPGIYTEWSSTYTQTKNCLTVPSGFKGYSGILCLSVCIRKCISSEFEVEAEETEEEVFGNEDNDIANGALQVVLADSGVLDCSICHEPMCAPVFQCENGHLACCSCCSKVKTVCPICYPLGYKYTRCRGLEVAIESIGKKISCINETLAAAHSNKKSEHEQMRPPHSFQEDDVEPDLVMSEEDEDEDELELMSDNGCSIPTSNIEVVLFESKVLDCMICPNLLSPPVFQCGMGHLVCSRCCSENKGVCLCCMPINNRCRAFEKFIESISSISCINAGSGCKKTVPYNNKSKHEQSCPHAKCRCPYLSCSFYGSFKSLYFHFDIKHTTSTTRFTYGTTFSICIDIDQTTIFLQEQNENVIFILNHEVQEYGRAFYIDCVGVGCFKSCFVYQLTAKNTEETCLSLRSVPEIYTEWTKDTTRKCCNLTVPSWFADYEGILSLSVCIKKKVISSEFEEEMKMVRIDDDIPNLEGTLNVMLTNLDMFYCSTCFKPLRRPVIQCEEGHLSCSSCCSEIKKLCPLCDTSIGSYGYDHSIGLENIIDTAIIPFKLRLRLRDHSDSALKG